MPRYDYECDICHHRFEVRQSFDSKPFANCPVCQGSSHRKIHVVPVVFKGSGWYVNDYGKRGSAAGSSSDSKESSPSDSKAEKKSEKKSESVAKDEPKAKSRSAKTKGD